MSIAYDDDMPPGLTGTHYGLEGIGILGIVLSEQTDAGTNGSGLIQQATTVNDAKEYRLQIVSGFNGLSIMEDGSGSATVQGVATLRLYEDGIEL